MRTLCQNLCQIFVKNLQKTALTSALFASIFALSACDNSNAKTTTEPKATTATTTQNTSATSAKNDDKLQKTLSDNLAKSGINAKILSVTPTSMPNMFWVKAEGLPAFFTDNTGQYVLQGDIIKVGDAQPEHISAKLVAEGTKQTLASIDKKDMIIFPAKGKTQGVIYAFTDADCGYCRKLHSEIDQINGLGIEVRYLPWPRSEQTFPIMEAIWCSPDRQKSHHPSQTWRTCQCPSVRKSCSPSARSWRGLRYQWHTCDFYRKWTTNRRLSAT